MRKVADWCRAGAYHRPKVSVATITYGHEAFIADAIESVLMQEVDFPVEMVIGEDCSPDRTRSVILDYMKRFPGLIRLSDYPGNKGANLNFRTTLARCRGEYVALLDGDDYWLSPHKLRKQADLLDGDPSVSMCFHSVNRVCDGRVVKAVVHPAGRRRLYRLPDLSYWLNISTSAMMYRRSALPTLPEWFTGISQGDWALQILLAEKGEIAHIPKLMGTHRLHDGNFWSGSPRPKSDLLLAQIHDIGVFISHLGAERARPFERSRLRRYYELAHAYLDEGEVVKARHVLRLNRRECGYDPKVEPLEPWLSYLHMNAPGLYGWLRLDAGFVNGLLHRSWARLVRPVLNRTAL